MVGLRAFGLDTDESDTDRRGIYLPPAELQWSLYGVPEQLENDGNEECYWELQKFLIMALKGNPNILECLYTPLVAELETAMENSGLPEQPSGKSALNDLLIRTRLGCSGIG